MATAMNIPAPRRAEKKKVKLKLGVQGPSGSGKTWGALSLATNLWPGARICVVDAENGSAELYADKFEFDTIPLNPPFHTDRYIACIDRAVRDGYDVLIIDQISHQWDGEGGILRRKGEMDARGGNSYANWEKFTPEHERFKQAIVQAPIHIISTMRSKQDYIIETNEKGKQAPRKVGMAAVQRDGFEYEFSLAFELQMDHRGTVTKDRTTLFNEQIVDLASPKIADAIRNWIDSGIEVKQETGPPPVQPPAPGRPVAVQSPGPWSYSGLGMLICQPISVQKRVSKSNQQEFVAVKLNGKCEGQDMAFCWHTGLFEAVEKSHNKPAQFQVELAQGFLNITDVDYIDSVEYRDGQPYVEPTPPAASGNDSLFITDDDIPF